MSSLLELLLNGKTLDEVQKKSAKNLREVSSRSNFRAYTVTRDGAMSFTEMYPEIHIPESKKVVNG